VVGDSLSQGLNCTKGRLAVRDRRFLVSTQAILGEGPIRLSEKEARHLAVVLRLGVKDTVELIDGKGHLLKGEIQEINPKKNLVLIKAIAPPIFQDDRLPIILFTGLLRSEKMDLVVQKASEMGIEKIIPVITQRSVARPGKAKTKRWETVALQALKQCKGLMAPDITPPISFEAIPEVEKDLKVSFATVLALDPGLPSLLHCLIKNSTPYAIFVGPEGGFTEYELSFLKNLGFTLSSLAPRVLRAETACIASIGIAVNITVMAKA